MKKTTLILGATTNTDRYAYLAAERLKSHGHPIIPVGVKKGVVLGEPIRNTKKMPTEPIDTVTLYVGPWNQAEWYDYVLQLRPKRIIFNPGTENEELEEMATKAGIETVEGCTLVMLAAGTY